MDISRCSRGTRPDGAVEVDANARWLLWQTLVGAWPLDVAELPAFADRVRDYALKAAREAKERTSWTEPDEAYENALADLVTRSLEHDGALFAALTDVVERIAWPAAVNGLSLALVLLAAPGLPDVYQGTERWSFSLVDPDNRRPSISQPSTATCPRWLASRRRRSFLRGVTAG